MQREVKFRVIIDGKDYYWGWVNNQFIGLPIVSGLSQKDVFEKSCQFTGLLDKNGKEIYEGDIIQWNDSYILEDSKKYKAVMEWKGQIILPHINPTSEIIGNIYEHPELLK